MKNSSANSLVNAYENSADLDGRDLVTLISDFLLAGVDTSANTMAFLLYELSRSQEVQENLNKATGDQNSILNQDILNQFKWGKAIIKETLRLHPVSVGVGRYLAHSAVFSGYHVPEGAFDFVGCCPPLLIPGHHQLVEVDAVRFHEEFV